MGYMNVKPEIDLVFYHADCPDGFCAAWLLWQIYPEAEFVPMNYDDTPPDVTGRGVVITDSSFSEPVLRNMAKESKRLILIDHHKTTLDAFPKETIGTWPSHVSLFLLDDVSGARLTWQVFCYWLTQVRIFRYLSLHEPPWLVAYTEDRDLWRWELDCSEEINMALRSYPFDFEAWNQIFPIPVEDLGIEGAALVRWKNKLVDDAAKKAHTVTIDGIDGHYVYAANVSSRDLLSEVAGKLAQRNADEGGPPVGIAYFRRLSSNGHTTVWQYSIRSRETDLYPEAFDVSAIAKLYGGGGHARAAGFKSERAIF